MVIPTYNPKGDEHSDIWKMAIDAYVAQRKSDLQVDIVVADNTSTREQREHLHHFQQITPNLFVIYTNQRYPMNVCINHAWMLMKEHNYDYYGYACSDIIFTNPDSISTLVKEMQELPDCAIISAQVDCDMCDVFRHINVFDPNMPATPLKISQGVNGHFYLCDKEFLKAYDWKRVDVLWGHRAESFVSYQCAAVRRREYLSHKVILHHYRKGNENTGVERDGFEVYDKPYETWGTKEDFLNKMTEGTKVGLGFEELYDTALHPVAETRLHDPSIYGVDGFPKDEEARIKLYNFIKDNLFLKPEHLNYYNIQYEFKIV